MNAPSGARRFYLTVLSAVTALLFTGAFAHAQSTLYQLDWQQIFNNSAGSTDSQDNWVANSFTVSATGTHIVSISLPLAGTSDHGQGFTNQAISALIYQGFDLHDPTAGGGLMLLGRTDTTITTKYGDIVTLTLNPPVDVASGSIIYAAVLLPGIPPDHFPFYLDISSGSGNLGTTALGRSFFDVGLTFGGAYDVNQLPDNSANITVMGGGHPVLGPGIQNSGNLALWVNATTGM
jgi:hypothetical protein